MTSSGRRCCDGPHAPHCYLRAPRPDRHHGSARGQGHPDSASRAHAWRDGISCLADGADQIFARAVTDLGGQLEVIVPAAEYRDRLPEEAHREYDGLLAQATLIRRLPFAESTSESHMEASKAMIDDADELYAVWDGQPARAYGGTADVVTYAREHGTPVHVISPPGAQRD